MLIKLLAAISLVGVIIQPLVVVLTKTSYPALLAYSAFVGLTMLLLFVAATVEFGLGATGRRRMR